MRGSTNVIAEDAEGLHHADHVVCAITITFNCYFDIRRVSLGTSPHQSLIREFHFIFVLVPLVILAFLIIDNGIRRQHQ